MDKDTLISVSAVIYNCEKIIQSFVDDVIKVLSKSYKFYEIVLIDNGSTDGTVEEVKRILNENAQIRFLVLSRHNSDQVAWTAALENCIGDYIILIDIYTDPPELIPKMIKVSNQGYDVVLAKRLKRKGEPIWYRYSAKIFYWCSNIFTEYNVDLSWSNYVCFSRNVVNSIIQVKNRIRYLKYLTTEIGYSKTTINYEQIVRSPKHKKRFVNQFIFALETLFSSSEKILGLVPPVALLTCIFNVIYIIFALSLKIFTDITSEGWTSVSMILSLMFAILFFLLFIISEFVLLIYKEIKKGPLYHIAREYTSSALFDDFKDKNVDFALLEKQEGS